MTAALLAGAASGAYSLVSADGGTPLAGCDVIAGGDCDAVLQSPWATWAGLPVSKLGFGLYCAFGAGWLLVPLGGPIGRIGWWLVDICVPAALGGAPWFIALQAVAVGHWCVWCLVVHACGVLAALLAILLRHAASRQAAPSRPVLANLLMTQPGSRTRPASQWFAAPPGLGVPTAIGVLGLVALVGVQIFYPPQRFEVLTDLPAELDFDLAADRPSTGPAIAQGGGFDSGPLAMDQADAQEQEDADSSPGVEGFTPPAIPAGPPRRPLGERVIQVLDGKLRLNAYDHPILGSPEAQYVVVEIMDYACSECRKTQPLIFEALQRFDGKVAVVVLPWPTDVLCNSYVKKPKPEGRGSCRLVQLAIAVARADPDAFAAYHAWLTRDPKKAAKFMSARIEAEKFVDVNSLRREYDDPKTEQLRQQYIELFAQLAQGRNLRLPCQIVGNSIVSGAPENLESLIEVWEKHLGIKASPAP
ncbi:Vitamin K epoxide reductase family protein [Pirellulimonas nuda]|uniref:Vitamin K epoxide reductase family protein n=1 Tax=Pirellulimonas nuda TaxID=2528009 RepID=A0A518DAW5_9BACT|nr:Vitamin K epoxide reductase family protein [Pirellulimonas nuda]